MAKQGKWTPRPWNVEIKWGPSGCPNVYVLWNPAGNVPDSLIHSSAPKEARANKALMEAAPAMAEALQEAPHCGSPGFFPEERKDIQAFFNKYYQWRKAAAAALKAAGVEEE